MLRFIGAVSLQSLLALLFEPELIELVWIVCVTLEPRTGLCYGAPHVVLLVVLWQLAHGALIDVVFKPALLETALWEDYSAYPMLDAFDPLSFVDRPVCP